MSLKQLTLVWEHSVQKGNALVLLLAIADFADDNGRAYPGVETLARKGRMSERNTRYVLDTLVASGELEIKRGAGPKGTNLYHVRINPSLRLFDEGAEVAPHATAVAPGANPAPPAADGSRGCKDASKRGATATTPEPSGTVKEPSVNAAGAAPSPVAACFRIYSEGIKKRYGADYPKSAKANGQLTQVVSRVGAEPAVAVTRFYVASSNPWYVKVKHSLDFLVRDCERIWLEVQTAAGSSGAKPPTHASVTLLSEDRSAVRDLGARELARPEDVAQRAIRDYSRMVSNLGAKHILVKIGAERHVFSIAELTQPAVI